MKRYEKLLLILAVSSVIFVGCTNTTTSSSGSSQSSDIQVSLEISDSSSAPEAVIPDVTLEKVAQANTGKAFLEAYGKVSKDIVEYQWYGHDEYTATFYIEGTAEEQSTAYEDSNGYIEVTTDGRGYVYDPSDDRLAVRCYFDDEYQKTLDQSVDLFVFQEMDYEEIVSVELNDAGDTLELITEFDVADDLEYYQETYGIESGKIRNIYQLDPETLRIRSLEVKLTDGGASSPICLVTVNTEASYVVPDKITSIMNSEKNRTVTFVLNPDTAEEHSQVETIAADAELTFLISSDYELYIDRACTQPYAPDGKLGDVILYLKAVNTAA